MIFGGAIVRFFASAAKGKGTKQVVPEKKKKVTFSLKKNLVKKVRVSDQSEPLKEALFSVEPEKIEYKPSEEELERRSIIAKAWSRYCGAKDKSQKIGEYFFLLSKVKAMQELEAIDVELAEKAKEISYSCPPPRKLPTVFPPSKLPFD